MSHRPVPSTPARFGCDAVQVRGPVGRCTTALAIGALTGLLAACGGPAPETVAAAPALAPTTTWRSGADGSPVAAPGQPDQASGALATGAAAPRYDLILLNGRAVHQDLDQLDPRQGKGYQPLQAFVYVKGRPRASSPVASVKPVCLPDQCEYIPARKAGHAERYVISVSDGSVVQLSASEDTVVISARELGQAKPVTVDVTLTIPGQAPIVKRIVYGTAPG